jgi:hypothetical protein
MSGMFILSRKKEGQKVFWNVLLMELVKTLQSRTEKAYSPFDVEKQQQKKLTVSGKLPSNFFLSTVVVNTCSASIFQ